MKKIFFVLVIFLSVSFSAKTQQTASIMSIDGKTINDKLHQYDPSGDGIIILKLITDGTNIYPDAFLYNRTTTPHFVNLALNNTNRTSPLNAYYPFYIGTLKWKYDEDADAGFTFDDGTIYYFIPIVYNNHLIYTIKSLAALKKISGINDLADLKELNKEQRLELIAALASSGGSFNPIPPKLVP
jgi:hypothetical protein